MERIIYISTARAVPDSATVENILCSSRRNNRRDGLTGLLVVGGKRFLQVIEGPRAQIASTYVRIKADPRHDDLIELSRRPITRRAFGDWDMGCEHLDAADLDDLVLELSNGLDDAALSTHFRAFVEHHRDAA